jgi:hypothetical protein
MMMKMKISADTAKCKGEAPDGTNKCAYREACLRYAAPANERQVWADFWKSGDDCVQYLSIPKVVK